MCTHVHKNNGIKLTSFIYCIRVYNTCADINVPGIVPIQRYSTQQQLKDRQISIVNKRQRLGYETKPGRYGVLG